MHRSLVAVAIAAAGCSIPKVDVAAMRAGAPAPAIRGSKLMSVAFTSRTILQLVDRSGAEGPWLRAGTLYLDDHSICVDADVPRWKFVVSIAVRAPDARAIASITRPLPGVTVSRAGDDWVLRGEPAALRQWFVAHVTAQRELERTEPGVQRGAYFAGLRGAAHWTAPSDPDDLERELDTVGFRVGWRWDDVLEVRAWPGDAAAHPDDNQPARVAGWIDPAIGDTQAAKDSPPKWLPVACPSGDAAPQRYAGPQDL